MKNSEVRYKYLRLQNGYKFDALNLLIIPEPFSKPVFQHSPLTICQHNI